MKATRAEIKLSQLRNKAQNLRNNGNLQEIAYSTGVSDTLDQLKEFLNEGKEQRKVKKLYGRR